MKADLHLHSRHSARAPEWLFRRVGLPDSYTDPRALYDKLALYPELAAGARG